jgi:dipeptide/tripeptide permease
MISDSVGAFFFGIVIGWITYRTLRRTSPTGLSDIATVIGSIGGATVTGLFSKESGAFGSYSVGLAIGFFLYLLTATVMAGKAGQSATVNEWLGVGPGNVGSSGGGGNKLEGIAGRN